jgi:DNA-binding NarL/FixJ family response regulator
MIVKNMLRIAIVFQRSLFAAGIASRLREAGFVDVCLMDVNRDQALEKVIDYRPHVVIYDSMDSGVVKDMWVFAFLKEIPGVRLIQVDYEREQMQVYCSQQMPAREMHEVISAMQKTIAVSVE